MIGLKHISTWSESMPARRYFFDSNAASRLSAILECLTRCGEKRVDWIRPVCTCNWPSKYYVTPVSKQWLAMQRGKHVGINLTVFTCVEKLCDVSTSKVDFCCDCLLLMNVKEWISHECAECVFLHLNIRVWFTRSHPSKGEIRNKNREVPFFEMSNFCCIV